MPEVNEQVRNKYLLQQIENATPIQRIVMLFDAAIRFLNEAREGITKRKDKVVFCERILRTKDIIRELRNSLNLDIEPTIGGNMYRLYTYFLKRLNDANRTKKTDDIDFVVKQMTVLNNAWKEADRQGLGRDIKRYEERMGTDDVNIIRRVKPTASPFAMNQQSGGSLLETLNVRV